MNARLTDDHFRLLRNADYVTQGDVAAATIEVSNLLSEMREEHLPHATVHKCRASPKQG